MNCFIFQYFFRWRAFVILGDPFVCFVIETHLVLFRFLKPFRLLHYCQDAEHFLCIQKSVLSQNEIINANKNVCEEQKRVVMSEFLIIQDFVDDIFLFAI